MKKLIIILLVVGLVGCATSSKRLQEVSLGMNKKEVSESLGEPDVVRGAIRNKFNQVIEVWEYKLALPTDDSAGTIIGKSVFTILTFGMGAATFRGERRNYWLYYYNDELVQWGQAGDWSREADRIYQINFDSSPKISRTN